jgi:hypothetical protein
MSNFSNLFLISLVIYQAYRPHIRNFRITQHICTANNDDASINDTRVDPNDDDASINDTRVHHNDDDACFFISLI